MKRRPRPFTTYQMRGVTYSQARWEHEVRAEARKGWRWLIYGPVAGIFAAVAVALLKG